MGPPDPEQPSTDVAATRGVADPEPPQLRPEEAGVDPSQRAGTPDPHPVVIVDRPVIGQSEIVAAIREAGTAFRGAAPQVLLAGITGDLTSRLDRREQEIADLRTKLSEETVARVRAEERLNAIKDRTASNDLLKILGGAAIGAGIRELFQGQITVGLIGIAIGLILARFGGASLPRLWGS
jgi:hypothetical protein